MDPVLERLNGQLMVVCAIPEEDQIKINGDMYGPIKTPHPIYINDVKLMLFYGKEVKAVDPDATPEEIEAAELLTLEVLEAAEELFLLEEEAAKEEQRDIELRIEEIDKILKNAELVTDDDIDSSVISIGCTVKIKDLEYNEEMEYKLVGSTEANSLKGKISNESPVGKALIGAQKGHTVMVETPAGMLKYKILEITKN